MGIQQSCFISIHKEVIMHHENAILTLHITVSGKPDKKG